MARKTPTVQDGKLTWPNSNRDHSIAVGTPEWHAWLSNAESFRFVTADGTFTACKEHFQRGGWYWRAYRSRAGRVHKAYLGKADGLTYDRLEVVAASLAMRMNSDARSNSQVAARFAEDPQRLDCPSFPDRTTGLNPPDQLFATKLSPPPSRPDLVTRLRLLGLLSQGLKRQLTLITAPPGSGKTTLLSQWVFESKYPFAWVSLNGSDNDPARFWAYVIAAVQKLYPHLGHQALSLLRSSQATMQSVIEALVDDFEKAPADFVLVLDDYHVVESQPIHDALGFLLEHLPRRAHLVIASRSDPSLPVSRLRGRGQLTEVRAEDLSLTPDEAASFLNEVMGLDLSAEQVATLTTRTEGWAVGLQLAALSLQSCRDVGSFIEVFAGSHRHVVAYLMGEVFANQPPSIQSFLLQTSILDRLSASLCNAVTGKANGREMLERLERANLFTVPLDNGWVWYRYHHLFSEFLQAVLQRQHPQQVAPLHLRASKWYAANGLISKGAIHALAAGEPELAAGLVEQDLMPMFRRGEFVTLRAWMTQLPEAAIRSRPRLCVYHALALAYGLQLDAAEKWVEETERYLAEDRAGETVESRGLWGEVLAVRAVLAACLGDDVATIKLSIQALELLPEDNPIRPEVTLSLAFAYRLRGDIAGASRKLADGNIMRHADGTVEEAGPMLSELAGLQAIQGKLHQAASTYRLASKLDASSGKRLYIAAGNHYIGMARLLYEWNDLEGAMRHVTKGIELGRKVDGAAILVLGHMVLARLRQAQGDLQGALDATVQGESLAGSTPYVRLIPTLAEYRARLWLKQGRLEAVAGWAASAGLYLGDEPSYRREAEYMTFARLKIAQGRPDDAVDLLDQLLRVAESEGRMGRVIKILALRALALEAVGSGERALGSLARALSLGELEGYMRTFVDEGEPMAALLVETLEANRRGEMPDTYLISTSYVGRLQSTFEAGAGWHSEKEVEAMAVAATSAMFEGGRPVVPPPLVEPLTERELEVLGLLAEGASDQEIAQRIVVELATAKKHAVNIYGKLSVHSRTQAIVRARQLGLLS